MTKKKSSSDLQQELDKLSCENSDDLPRWKEAYQKCNKARMFLKRNKNIIELLDTELILEYKMMIEQNKVLATQYKKIMNLESKIRTKKIEESREAKLRSFEAGQRAKKFNSATTDPAKAKLKPTPRRYGQHNYDVPSYVPPPLTEKQRKQLMEAAPWYKGD